MTQHKKEPQEFNVKNWLGNIVSMFIVGGIGFVVSTAIHSWNTDEVDARLNKQDVINATVADAIVDIKDDIHYIKLKLDK